jgi:hypothetical protein
MGRATGFVRWLAGIVLRLAIAALIAGVLVWWAVLRAVGESDARTGLALLLGFLLLAPPFILGLFVLALRSLSGLPARLREAGGQVGGRVDELRRRLADVARARQRGVFSGIAAFFRLGWSLRSSRELLEIAGPAAFLLSPALLAAMAAAMLGSAAEILAGGIALIWLALA